MLRYTTAELVPTAFSDAVLKSWDQRVSREMGRSGCMIDGGWLYQEAMSYLFEAVLEHLGVRQPIAVSISLVGDFHDGTYCEVLFVWSAATKLDPEEVLCDCMVTRLNDIFLMPAFTFNTNIKVRHEVIADWACRLSAIADYLPQKEG